MNRDDKYKAAAIAYYTIILPTAMVFIAFLMYIMVGKFAEMSQQARITCELNHSTEVCINSGL